MSKSKALVAIAVAVVAGLLIMQATQPAQIAAPTPAATTPEAAAGSEHALEAPQGTPAAPEAAQPQPEPEPIRRGRRVEDLDEQTLQVRKVVSRSSKNWSWIRHQLSGAGEDAYPLRDEALQLLSDLRDAESDIDMADLQALQDRSEELASRIAASPYVNGQIQAKLLDLQSNPIPNTP